MKGNVWLAGFIVLSLFAIGASGFYMLKQYGVYQDQFGSWDRKATKIAKLSKEVPTPTEENEAQFVKELEAYEAKVAELFEALNQFQRPLNKQLDQQDFPNILKQKVDDFRKLAGENKVNIEQIEKPLPFFMAMDRYRERLPNQEITPLLSYQLDATERVLKHLIDARMGRIVELSREVLPGEVEEIEPDRTPAAGDSNVVLKYPIQVIFEGSHSSFRDFLNRLANDKEYFFILRVLSVANTAPDGPSFGADLSIAGYMDDSGNDIPNEDIDAVLGGLTGEDLQTKLNEVGWIERRQDAAIIFGEEKVEVNAVIDLVRFLPPEESDDSPAESGESAGNS